MRIKIIRPGRLGRVRRWNLPGSSQLLKVFSGNLTTIRAQTRLLAPATLSSRATRGSHSPPSLWAPALTPTKSGLFAETHQGCSLGQSGSVRENTTCVAAPLKASQASSTWQCHSGPLGHCRGLGWLLRAAWASEGKGESRAPGCQAGR